MSFIAPESILAQTLGSINPKIQAEMVKDVKAHADAAQSHYTQAAAFFETGDIFNTIINVAEGDSNIVFGLAVWARIIDSSLKVNAYNMLSGVANTFDRPLPEINLLSAGVFQ